MRLDSGIKQIMKDKNVNCRMLGQKLFNEGTETQMAQRIRLRLKGKNNLLLNYAINILDALDYEIGVQPKRNSSCKRPIGQYVITNNDED